MAGYWRHYNGDLAYTFACRLLLLPSVQKYTMNFDSCSRFHVIFTLKIRLNSGTLNITILWHSKKTVLRFRRPAFSSIFCRDIMWSSLQSHKLLKPCLVSCNKIINFIALSFIRCAIMNNNDINNASFVIPFIVFSV